MRTACTARSDHGHAAVDGQRLARDVRGGCERREERDGEAASGHTTSKQAGQRIEAPGLQHASKPASGGMKAGSPGSSARKRTSPATSSGVPMRPAGMPDRMASMYFSSILAVMSARQADQWSLRNVRGDRSVGADQSVKKVGRPVG